MRLFKRANKTKSDLLILYGTRSGNSKLVAQQTKKYFEKAGIDSECKNMSGFKASELAEAKKALVIVSTHGEGEPPPSAKNFFKECFSDSMPGLNQLDYSICALGDSSYQEYCWAGKELDKRFAELGANLFYPRIDCDVEFSNDAIQWIKSVASELVTVNGKKQHTELSIASQEKSELFTAPISNRKLLTQSNDVLPVYHIELDISQANINYNIGDSIEIYPQNPEWLVRAIIDKICVNSPEVNEFKHQLIFQCEITSLSRKTMQAYMELTGSDALDNLLQTDTELAGYLKKANFLDLINDYPAAIKVGDLLSILPKIKGRQYSISSSKKEIPGKLHLTIKTVRFEYGGNNHEGAASVYANEILALKKNLSFRLIPNKSFSLPDDVNTPIIMIGVSTGIAPYRAILYERRSQQIKGNTWLIWGNKHQLKDYLYQDEIKMFYNEGILEVLDTAFSADGSSPCYVHEIIKEKSTQMKNWINNGAHVYVCGSIEMGKSVKKTITEVFANSENMLDILVQEGRFHEDTY